VFRNANHEAKNLERKNPQQMMNQTPLMKALFDKAFKKYMYNSFLNPHPIPASKPSASES